MMRGELLFSAEGFTSFFEEDNFITVFVESGFLPGDRIIDCYWRDGTIVIVYETERDVAPDVIVMRMIPLED